MAKNDLASLFGRRTRLPEMSLVQPKFEVSPFEAAIFKPEQEDLSLLANSLSKMEERKRNASEKIGAMDATFAKLAPTINNDAKTLQWFEGYKDKYKRELEAYARLGDYSQAINQGAILAGEALKDQELIGRQRYKQEYDDVLQKVNSRQDIKDVTKEWWKANHPYNYRDITDDNGNIIGGNKFDPADLPVKDVDWAEVTELAVKLINPDRTSTSTGSSSYRDGTGGSSERSRSFEQITPQQIRENMQDLYNAYPGKDREIEQAYRVNVWRLQQLEAQLATDRDNKDIQFQIKQLKDILIPKSGSSPSIETYYANMINSHLSENAAYKRTTNESRNANQVTTRNAGGGGGGGTAYAQTPTDQYNNGNRSRETSPTPAPAGTVTVNNGTNTNVVTNAVDNVLDRFGISNGK